MTSLTIRPKIKVDFEPSEDRVQYLEHPSISGATDYILSAGEHKEELMYIVGKIIHSCHNKQQFGFWVRGTKRDLGLELDNNILQKFIKVTNKLAKIYEPTQDTDNLRGAFLESIVYKLLSAKFSVQSYKSGLSCFVIIVTKSAWRSGKTVDVAFWSQSIGECHECKVKRGIDEKHIKNLNDISSNSFRLIKVAITTLHESNTFLNQLPPIPLDNVFVYGRENIFSICNT
jgi:hypothetical protein